jgi:hypothetical protein
MRWLCTAALVVSACSGTVSNPSLVGGEGASPSPDAPPGTGLDGPTDQPLGFRPAAAVLRKLTVHQYENTVRDLLGADVELPALEPDTSINGFFAIGAAKATLSPSATEKFEAAAFTLAEKALDTQHRAAFVGCTPAGTADDACTTAFVKRFGRRAFRRPLTDDEVARFVGLAKQAQTALADFHEGLQFAVAGILQSPNFLFRVELGKDVSSAMRPYDDYELATRLSYLLWNTTPDDALLDAASRGELSTEKGLLAQADRLLADPRAKSALDNFHSERLALEELDAVEKAASVYSGFDDALRTAMRNDVLDTIEEFTFGNAGDFRDLFTTRVAFVESKLASLYGLPAVKTSTRVELPADGERIGLLGKAAFLASNAHMEVTSPTKRGKYIRERLLCQSIPAPPPEVSTVLPEPDPSAPTMRKRLEAHVTIKSCAGCHTLMDPIGLSLEHFDTMGRYRADDKGFALDVTGKFDGSDYDGARELSELLREDESATSCVARQLYRYATAHVEDEGEEPAVDKVIESFEGSGFKFSALLRAVITSDGFRYGSKE